MDLLETIPDYQEFFTLQECDERMRQASKKYGFELKQVGTSEKGHPITLLKAGEGKKKAFLWGFPHPNEPIGSLMIDWLVNYFGEHPDVLKQTEMTWYFMVTADPEGMQMNEGWFKGKLTLRKYFEQFFRPPAHRMIDWTFPVQYKDFVWDAPLVETKVLMKLLDEIKPDLMYPLHNAGFGGAYFLATRRFDKQYYQELRMATEKLGIPLHLGEPEEEFMVEITKPFYLDFGFKEYYENIKKMGKDPRDILKHGDNSTHYLLKSNPSAVVIKGEVPYFFSENIKKKQPSTTTRRKLYLDFIENSEHHLSCVQPFLGRILTSLSSTHTLTYPMEEYQRRWEKRSDAFKNYVIKSSDFDRLATEAELFDGTIGAYFYQGGLLLGQVHRAALAAGYTQEELRSLQEKIDICIQKLDASSWKVLPIKNCVGLQAAVLFATLDALKRTR